MGSREDTSLMESPELTRPERGSAAGILSVKQELNEDDPRE